MASERGEDSLADGVWFGAGQFTQQPLQARQAEEDTARVGGAGQPVGKQHQAVAIQEGDALFAEVKIFFI